MPGEQPTSTEVCFPRISIQPSWTAKTDLAKVKQALSSKKRIAHEAGYQEADMIGLGSPVTPPLASVVQMVIWSWIDSNGKHKASRLRVL